MQPLSGEFDERELHRGHRSIRLKGYNYSSRGFYFVTICCNRKRCVLGRIVEATVKLSQIGQSVRDCWMAIPVHFSRAKLHEFMIMPNHLHGIIEIVGAAEHQSFEELDRLDRPPQIHPGSLPAIVRSFKAAAARSVREDLRWREVLWQRNYFERVLRDAEEFANATRYIVENPAKWEWDKENPHREPLHVQRPSTASST